MESHSNSEVLTPDINKESQSILPATISITESILNESSPVLFTTDDRCSNIFSVMVDVCDDVDKTFCESDPQITTSKTHGNMNEQNDVVVECVDQVLPLFENIPDKEQNSYDGSQSIILLKPLQHSTPSKSFSLLESQVNGNLQNFPSIMEQEMDPATNNNIESASLLNMTNESIPLLFTTADNRCTHIFSANINVLGDNDADETFCESDPQITMPESQHNVCEQNNVVIEYVDQMLPILENIPDEEQNNNDDSQSIQILKPLQHSTPSDSVLLLDNHVIGNSQDSPSIIEREIYPNFNIESIRSSLPNPQENQCTDRSITIHTRNQNGNFTSANNVLEDNDGIAVETSTDFSKSGSMLNKKGRKRKGRKRTHESQNRVIKKQKVNTNKDYINTKGIRIKKRTFCDTNFTCNCPLKCTEKVKVDIRKREFENFWKCGNFAARCAILQKNVEEQKVNRCYVQGQSSRREFTRKYYITGVKVCKKAFLNTYKISQSRVDIALKKKEKQELTDNRGSSGGKNKTSAEKTEEVIGFIKRFPKYKSHYCRSQSDVKYLAPNCNLQKVYDLYIEEHLNPVKLSIFKNIFYGHFNLRFKKPHKDTCLKCDVFQSSKQGATGNRLAAIEKEHQTHLDHAASLRSQMREDLQQAKIDIETETITFDLQKTHNLPCLPTGVLYYKRQLNFYNLGIHSGSTGKAFFHTWLEHEAGRGTQEVGSCIRKFITEELKSTATHLILWADSCGGQNRSIKLIVMLLHILLNHDRLSKITIRFLQSGHTFLPNDSEFGDVECRLKTSLRLYTDLDYIQVMVECRRKNKFTVKKMDKSQFKSVGGLLKAITNRKVDSDKNKISWLNTYEIELKKDTPSMMYLKSALNETSRIVDLSKNKKMKDMQHFKNITLPLLWPNGKELSSSKVKDLKDILRLIPEDCKEFYSFLDTVRTAQFEDDIEGIGRTLDYALEENEED